MVVNTGWQYTPNQSVVEQTNLQSQVDANPNVSTDKGAATASSPFLSATLQNASDGWGATSQAVGNLDSQAANQQASLWAQHQAQVNFKQQQDRLNKLVAQAEKQGQDAQAKAYQLEQQSLNSQRSYNYVGTQGTGALQGASGLSAQGRSQLATARADGYNLSASNYDRTYHYNNAYSAERNAALAGAYSWLGTHYVLDGETKQVSVDCSGLVQAIYSKLGFSIPLHSAEHEKDTIPGVRTSFSNLQPGDLVCWKDGSHIAIYAGNGEIIEAANTRVGTVRRELWDNPNNVVGIHLTFGDETGARGQRQQTGG